MSGLRHEIRLRSGYYRFKAQRWLDAKWRTMRFYYKFWRAYGLLPHTIRRNIEWYNSPINVFRQGYCNSIRIQPKDENSSLYHMINYLPDEMVEQDGWVTLWGFGRNTDRNGYHTYIDLLTGEEYPIHYSTVSNRAFRIVNEPEEIFDYISKISKYYPIAKNIVSGLLHHGTNASPSSVVLPLYQSIRREIACPIEVSSGDIVPVNWVMSMPNTPPIFAYDSVYSSIESRRMELQHISYPIHLDLQETYGRLNRLRIRRAETNVWTVEEDS